MPMSSASRCQLQGALWSPCPGPERIRPFGTNEVLVPPSTLRIICTLYGFVTQTWKCSSSTRNVASRPPSNSWDKELRSGPGERMASRAFVDSGLLPAETAVVGVSVPVGAEAGDEGPPPQAANTSTTIHTIIETQPCTCLLPLSNPLELPEPGVETVPEPISQEVQRHDYQEHGHPRKDSAPPGRRNMGSGLRHH